MILVYVVTSRRSNQRYRKVLCQRHFLSLTMEPVACKIYRTCDAIGNTNNECVATICTSRHEIREEKLKPTHDLFVFTSYTTDKRNKGNSCKLKNCRINTTNALLSSL